MPNRPPVPCSNPMCKSYASKRGRCEDHQVTGWSDHRGSAADRGYGHAWRKLRKGILKRDAYMCQRCYRNGKYRQGNEVDHITPKAAGGTDSPGNLECICTYCHRDKTAIEAARAREGR